MIKIYCLVSWGCRICCLNLNRRLAPTRLLVDCGWLDVMFENGILVTGQTVTR